MNERCGWGNCGSSVGVNGELAVTWMRWNGVMNRGKGLIVFSSCGNVHKYDRCLCIDTGVVMRGYVA